MEKKKFLKKKKILLDIKSQSAISFIFEFWLVFATWMDAPLY
jgi:hypothetical protein